MHLDWQITVVEPDSAPRGEQQVRTVVGVGPAARQLIAGFAARHQDCPRRGGRC